MNKKRIPSVKLTRKPERNQSLDLLRIVAMLMVIVLHVLGKGGMLGVYPVLSLKYDAIWFIELVAIVAVNCYVLLSGYFLVQSRFKLSRLLGLLAEVLFYLVIIYGIFVATGLSTPNLNMSLIAFLPVLSGEYWFITAYVSMYLLVPFLNPFLTRLSRVQHRRLLVGAVALFSIVPTINFFGDPFGITGNQLSSGYAASWFVVLYVIAAYLRRWYVPDYKVLRHLVRYAVVVLINFAVFIAASWLLHKHDASFVKGLVDYSLAYNALTVLVASLALFMVFLNLRIRSRYANKLIAYIAPLTLATYLIHENPHVRGVLWDTLAISDRAYSPTIALYLVACTLGIYGASIAIDLVRQWLFNVVSSAGWFKRFYVAIDSHARQLWRLAEVWLDKLIKSPRDQTVGVTGR